MNFWKRAFLLPVCTLVLIYFVLRNGSYGAMGGILVTYSVVYFAYVFIASLLFSFYIYLIKKKNNTTLFYLLWLIGLVGFHYAVFEGLTKPIEFLISSFGTAFLFIGLEYLLYRKKAKSIQSQSESEV